MSCPPGGRGGSVWGTDVYTSDSSVCEAAVHAGVIRRADGGVVSLRAARPADVLRRDRTQRRVATSSYGPWSGSFRFVIEEAGPNP